jgi:transporter family-2 protein
MDLFPEACRPPGLGEGVCIMDMLYLLLASLAGACAPAQAGINSQLGMMTRGPVMAALISFAVGVLTLGLYCLLSRVALPEMTAVRSIPWWMWTGGCLGAFLVAATIFLVPKLGAATLMAAMVAGQMLASLLLDHNGWLGYPVHPMSEWRSLGALLVVAGVVIIRTC